MLLSSPPALAFCPCISFSALHLGRNYCELRRSQDARGRRDQSNVIRKVTARRRARRKITARRRASKAKDAKKATLKVGQRYHSCTLSKKKKRPQWDSNHPLQVYDCARGIVEKRPDSCRVTSMLVYDAQHYIYLSYRLIIFARSTIHLARSSSCYSFRFSLFHFALTSSFLAAITQLAIPSTLIA